MKQKLAALAQVFCLAGEITDYKVISNGNINATYDVTMMENGKERRFVFQKLNIFVFKSPKRIMKNIEKITSHIADKLEAKGEEMGMSIRLQREDIFEAMHRV